MHIKHNLMHIKRNLMYIKRNLIRSKHNSIHIKQNRKRSFLFFNLILFVGLRETSP